MKYIMVVPDGMWDEPVEELGWKTPLECAETPTMDAMAANSYIGYVNTVPDGFAPGSDVANMSLLGYAPAQYYGGRAPLEAANIGIRIEDDEVGFRCNLVTVVDGRMRDYSAGHISTREAEYLLDDLNRHIKKIGLDGVEFFPGTSYRNLLKIKTEDKDAFLSLKCYAPHNITGKKIDGYLPSGPDNAQSLLRRLMEISMDVFAKSDVNKVRIDLKENPATMIWLWGQGIGKEFPPFSEKYNKRGAIISAVDLLKGLGRIMGLDVIEVEGATGYYDTNYRGKAEAALKAAEDRDFVLVHIEATDEAGHNGHIDMKVKCIERIDKMLLSLLHREALKKDIAIMVVPDHPTPVKRMCHTADPVGFMMWHKDLPSRQEQTAFCEKALSPKDSFPLIEGTDLLKVFFSIEKK